MRSIRAILTSLVLFGVYLPLQIFAQPQKLVTDIPNFWDSNIRFVKPDDLNITRLRFLTTTDFPPFNFIDRNKRLNGFHIDIARQICAELDILRLCQIQALPWGELDQAIENGEGEVIISGLEMTSISTGKYEFSQPFLEIPARFVTLRASDVKDPLEEELYQKTTALVKGSSHAKYFKAIFSNRKYQEFETILDARNALLTKKVDTVFSDAVSMAFWLSSQTASNCCRFVGGPYLSREYFGNGLMIAVKKGNSKLVAAINFALSRINDNGTFRELYLRYFPIGLY